MKLLLNRLNWKLASSLLLLTLVSGCLFPYNTPRSGELHGRVLDAVTREPIQGANISFMQKPRHAIYTDASGRFARKAINNFHILALPPDGDWPANKNNDSEISHPGYQTLQGDWAHDAGDILLQPVPKAEK